MKAFPPAYPFLFAFAPILGLFADNYFVTSPIDVLRPLIATTCSVLAGYAFNYILVRNFQKAAVLTLVAIIVIFAYGPVRNILPPDILRTAFTFQFGLQQEPLRTCTPWLDCAKQGPD